MAIAIYQYKFNWIIVKWKNRRIIQEADKIVGSVHFWIKWLSLSQLHAIRCENVHNKSNGCQKWQPFNIIRFIYNCRLIRNSSRAAILFVAEKCYQVSKVNIRVLEKLKLINIDIHSWRRQHRYEPAIHAQSTNRTEALVTDWWSAEIGGANQEWSDLTVPNNATSTTIS